MLVDVTLNCTVPQKTIQWKKNNNNNKNNKQNINKQPPTCTCPSINKLTAGALVICKKNRYAHWQVQNTVHGSQVQVFALLINNWDKQLTPPPPPFPLCGSFYHLFDTEILASTGSDITIQLANFFFPNMQQYILAELHFRHIQNYDFGRIICSKEYGGWSFEQGVNSVYQNQIFQ